MNTGIVKWFNTVKGYGFITPDDGTTDAFVHITAVQESGLRLIVEGQKLKYQMIESKNGKLAAGNLELVGEEQEAVQFRAKPVYFASIINMIQSH